MATIRNKFHDLGNWHNKISMGSTVTKEALSDPDLTKLPPEELKKIIDKSVETLGKFEGYIIGADKVTNEIKSYIYENLGADTDLSQKPQKG